MAEVGGNIRKYRTLKDLRQADLAKLLGKTSNVITNWESGLNRPDIDSIEKMLAIFDIDANEFFGYKSTTWASLSSFEQTQIKKYRALDEHGKIMVDFTLGAEHERTVRLLEEARLAEQLKKEQIRTDYIAAEPGAEDDPQKVEMKVYWQPAAAGMGNYLSDDGGYDLMTFSDAEIPPQADFGVRISGDSMEPRISDGDIVWVKAAPQIEDGDIGIFILNGNALCKKLHVDYSKRKITLVSLNPKRANIEIKEFDENLRTVGKVLLRR